MKKKIIVAWILAVLISIDLIAIAIAPVILFWILGKDWILLTLVFSLSFVSWYVVSLISSMEG